MQASASLGSCHDELPSWRNVRHYRSFFLISHGSSAAPQVILIGRSGIMTKPAPRHIGGSGSLFGPYEVIRK